MSENTLTTIEQMDGGTYEIIRRRLAKQADDLRARMDQLNASRKEVFGAVDMQLLANDRITTENNCIPVDMVAIGNHFIFGYNVHVGLRAEIQIKDVFATYRFENSDHSFHQEENSLIQDATFEEDFHNLYRYYKDTVFVKFAVIGPHLFMVFRIGKGVSDIKTFKWAIGTDSLQYLGNRFDHEFRFPDQQEFSWKRTTREMHRRGTHPHVSVEDRAFVETVGGDLTIKVEDNTDSGKGIYEEPVDNPDQTLDDADIYYADLGNLIVLKVRPYQEKEWRYIIFNEKMQEALRVDSIGKACVMLPDQQGLIFANGYYLQTGEYKIFDNVSTELHFEKRIASDNGEDFLYMFYNQEEGGYVLLPYNLVKQSVDTPIHCNGFSIFTDGELCYFRSEETAGRHHVVQVWQTPYAKEANATPTESTSFLAKVGNKDLVRGMAECNELLTLLGKGDDYGNLYVDLVKKTTDILDSYYWIKSAETANLDQPLAEIREAAASAIDEFEKVRKIRQNTKAAIEAVEENQKALFDKIRRYKPKSIDQFVGYLAELRSLIGEIIGLKDLRYVDLEKVAEYETAAQEKSNELSESCVAFLLTDDALKPYHDKVAEVGQGIEAVSKVKDANDVSEIMDALAKELELLIETVSNLKIDDATQTTQIIEQISGIYSELNGARARLKKRRKELLGTEATAEFQAQINLLNQGLVNYLDLCDTPQKCDDSLTRMMVQLEELEGKFSEFDQFIGQLGEKREEIYNAFETRKLSLVESRNKRANALMSSAERILKGIQNRLSSFEKVNDINSYFAADLMVSKVRDIIGELTEMQDSVKAGDLQAQLKTLREDAIRQLQDRTELFVDGENIIRFGRHQFSVNTQTLDLTIVPRKDEMCVHLTGTNFFEAIDDEDFVSTRSVWSQSLISENQSVYRAEYLAWRMLSWLQQPDSMSMDAFQVLDAKEMEQQVRDFMSRRFEEGYVKGIHDHDAALLLSALAELHGNIELLRFTPEARACAQLFWLGYIGETEKNLMLARLKGAGEILQLFPNTQEFGSLIDDIAENMRVFLTMTELFDEKLAESAADYLFHELALGESFVVSKEAADLHKAFLAYLKKKKFTTRFNKALDALKEASADRYELIRTWLRAFVESNGGENPFAEEAAALVFRGGFEAKEVVNVSLHTDIKGLVGEHAVIEEGKYTLDYHAFVAKMKAYDQEVVPLFKTFTEEKSRLLTEYRESLRLESFRPRVLTSFVRNQLIDKLYLPIIGDNLAKQMGTVGDQTRTDRMGLLLLISPPGYGKTTLMEYVANRLGLIFMKVNGPAIGHQVTSLDPVEAPNAAAREELAKLNLALEMGDNVMLYVDDIQHCHPEFLQKFISLCDAQRKIEGVYKGKTRTYDLRGKKVAVVMAGNPYTESGEKFQIPDMLANRADTYNLGDIIGDSADLFKLSYIENSLTSNQVLSRMSSMPREDVLAIIEMAEGKRELSADLSSNLSGEELQEMHTVLQKLFVIRDVILNVNQAYIKSAGQEDLFRTEPPFLLQGSYRNMNKLVEKVAPIMNNQELETLILSHYEGESQTLTSGAEANMIRFKEMNGFASDNDATRWEEICRLYREQKSLSADKLSQLVREMGSFSEGLKGIQEALEKGISRNGSEKGESLK